MNLKLLFIFMAILSSSFPSVVSAKSKGISLYEKEKFKEAQEEFLQNQIQQPKDLPLQYNIGNTHYRLEQYDEAAKAYADVAGSGDPDLAWQAFYNLGNVSYQQGKLEEAIAYFEKALALNPKDEDTKHNLEFVRKELKRRINESIENPPPEQQKDQQKQEQQPQAKNEPKPGEGKQEPTPTETKPQESAMNKNQAENILSNLSEGRKPLQKNKEDQDAEPRTGVKAYGRGDKDW